MDVLAKSALLAAVLDDNVASGFFPVENVVVTIDGSKVTGSSLSAIGSVWGYEVAWELFHSRRIVDRKHFV